MGSKTLKSLVPSPKDLIPGNHLRRTIQCVKEDANPKMPGPTEAEQALEARQRETLAGLDEEENVRLKRGLRGQLGSRRSSSARRVAGSSLGGGASASGASSAARPRSGGSGYAQP